MAETLDSLGAKFDAFVDRVDKRFNEIDKRFDGVDKRFDEVKSELGVKIEAVEALARLAVERLDDVLRKDVGNSAVHARSACGPREESESSSAAARARGGGAPRAVRMDMRIENPDLRILALEGRRPTDEG
jgi:hypothetical protein